MDVIFLLLETSLTLFSSFPYSSCVVSKFDFSYLAMFLIA